MALSYENNDYSYNYYLRAFTATGSQDTSVAVPSITGPIYGLTALSNGDILVTGGFTSVNGLPADGIARLNPDGTLDPSFSLRGLTTSLDLFGASVATQSDGKIVIASSEQVIRLLANGNQDLGFGNSGQVILNGYADSVAVQADDKILVGGSFTTVDDGSGPVNSGLLVRLTADGKVDPTLTLGAGFQIGGNYPYVGKVVVDPVGRIVLAGGMGYYNGTPVGSIIRLFPDGSLDPSFQVPASFDSSNFVMSGDGLTFYAGATLRRYFYNPTTTAPPMPFGQWQTKMTATGAPTDCPRHDGVPNLLKYLYDIDPSKPMGAGDRAALPVVTMTTLNGTLYLNLTYRLNATMTGLTVNLQTSSDMRTWTTVPNPSRTQMTTDATTGDPIMQVGVVAHGVTQYLRLNVTSP